MHFGFSYIGLIFLLMLFIPDIHWAKNKPEKYDEFSGNENKILALLERIASCIIQSVDEM